MCMFVCVYVWMLKPYIFNSRYELILSSIRMLLNVIFRCKEILVYFQVFSFLRSWKLTFLSPDLSKCNFILNFDFLLFYISPERLNNQQNLNFKTNLTYKPAKNPRYNIHGFDVMLMFPNLMPTIQSSRRWLVYFNEGTLGSKKLKKLSEGACPLGACLGSRSVNLDPRLHPMIFYI